MNDVCKSFAFNFAVYGAFSPGPAPAHSMLLQNQAAALLKCRVIYRACCEPSRGAAGILHVVFFCFCLFFFLTLQKFLKRLWVLRDNLQN